MLVRIAAGLASTMLVLAAARPSLAQSDPAEKPICTDRPTMANSPCTVPAGHFQIESDLVNWSRSSADGVSADLTLAPNPTYKYGVSKSLDVELEWAPWQQLRVSAGGRTTTENTVGDVVLRTKWAAVSGDLFCLSLIPYVKLPAASPPIGNGAVEGGLIAPISVNLPSRFTLTLGPELDALTNEDGEGSHLNLINLVNLSRQLGRWTLYAELWNQQTFNPAGTVAETTADVAVTYLLNKTLQLDAGANIGLTRTAPQHQLYLGVSHRF